MSSPSLPPLPDLNDTRAVAQWVRTTGAWTEPITADKLAVILRAYGDACAAAEREACAELAQQTICDVHLPTGVRIYGTKAAAAIRARGEAK